MSHKYYGNDYEFEEVVQHGDTEITLVDGDTLTVAQTLQKPCVLNFASHKNPGGGYKAVRNLKMPIKTQEEDLFRRSNLPELMDTKDVRKNYYPLKGVQGIYTTGIVVNKDTHLELIDPFEITMITVPAVVGPKPEDAPLVSQKVKRIYEIAAENGEQTLILGAWGCGAFRNEPETIASLFMEHLESSFLKVFTKLVFAIPNKNHINYKVFEETITSKTRD